MAKKDQLFSSFKAISTKEWMSKIETDLKGKSINSLDWEITKGLKISPIQPNLTNKKYEAIVKNGNNDWEIGEDLKVAAAKKTNQVLLEKLENGVEAPCLILSKIPSKTDFEKILANVMLDYISIHFSAKKKLDWLKFMQLINEVAPAFSKKPKSISGSISFDPFEKTSDTSFKMAKSLLLVKNRKSPHFKVLNLSAISKFDGDEQVVNEITTLLKKGSDCLELFSNKTNAGKVLSAIQFEFAIGLNYPLSIAKIRAFKKLWSLVLKAYGVKNVAPTVVAKIHPSTQEANPNTNMIRSTTQAMSAVIGGVDRLTILPSDLVTKKPTDFGYRISRNIHHLLKMESHLQFVEDPAAGSYYLETLTDRLCELSWSAFQKNEKESGR